MKLMKMILNISGLNVHIKVFYSVNCFFFLHEWVDFYELFCCIKQSYSTISRWQILSSKLLFYACLQLVLVFISILVFVIHHLLYLMIAFNTKLFLVHGWPLCCLQDVSSYTTMWLYSIKILKYSSFFSLMNNNQITLRISYKERRLANNIHGKRLAYFISKKGHNNFAVFFQAYSLTR